MQQPVPMRDIIVIGGSAGATAPLKTVLAALPASTQASVFVVLHIPTRSSGIPADAIADEMPRCAMRATEVDAAMPAAHLGDLLSTMAEQPAGALRPTPPDLQLEVEIAAGERLDSPTLRRISEPAPLTCPACGGVMSVMHEAPPLRFRCQMGHAMTAEVMAKEQEDAVDEAMRVALRVIEERATLVERMAREAVSSGRPHSAETYEDRSREYRHFANVLRSAVMASMGVDTHHAPPAAGDA